jgi:hypothetical protein
MDVLLWLAVLGPLAFWLVLPAAREPSEAIETRRNA